MRLSAKQGSWCEAIDEKMIFHSLANKIHFHNKVARVAGGTLVPGLGECGGGGGGGTATQANNKGFYLASF